jgi:hypothetical protein
MMLIGNEPQSYPSYRDIAEACFGLNPDRANSDLELDADCLTKRHDALKIAHRGRE